MLIRQATLGHVYFFPFLSLSISACEGHDNCLRIGSTYLRKYSNIHDSWSVLQLFLCGPLFIISDIEKSHRLIGQHGQILIIILTYIELNTEFVFYNFPLKGKSRNWCFTITLLSPKEVLPIVTRKRLSNSLTSCARPFSLSMLCNCSRLFAELVYV